MPQPFTDQDFMKFVGTLDASREQLHQSLQQWQSLDLRAVAQRPLAYLPAQATIRGEVYPVIKAHGNSFVFEQYTAAPAIFVYVDPKGRTLAQMENTLAHEAHHLGVAGIQQPAIIQRGDPQGGGQPESVTGPLWVTLSWIGHRTGGSLLHPTTTQRVANILAAARVKGSGVGLVVPSFGRLYDQVRSPLRGCRPPVERHGVELAVRLPG